MAACQPEAKFVKELPEKFKCSICTNLLVTPVLTECCGQHFCKACLKKWLKGKPMDMCPYCHTEKFNRIVSQPIIREINKLKVYCSNRDNGCGEIIAYSTLQKHVGTCQYGIVECSNKCGKEGLLRKDLEEHCQKKCFHRIVRCKLCTTRGMFRTIAGPHIKTCPEVRVGCLKCGERIKRKDIDDHKQVCPLEIVECPFSEAGCEVKLPRKDMEKHEDTSMRKHLRLTMTTTKREHEKLQSEHEKLQSEHKNLQTRFNTIVSIVSTELDSLHSKSHTRGSLLATPEVDCIRSMLRSVTMIKPDGTWHQFRLTEKLGMFKEPEMLALLKLKNVTLRLSSPCLCIHPDHKAYIGLGTLFTGPILIFMAENHLDYNIRDNISVEISEMTQQPLFKLAKLNLMNRDLASGTKFTLFFLRAFNMEKSSEYYCNICFHS